MKLTTTRLKKLIREEIENVVEGMAFKKTGIEKVKDPETNEIIMIDHDNEIIKILDPDGKPTNRGFVYHQDFATASPKGYIKMDSDQFDKTAKPKDLGVT